VLSKTLWTVLCVVLVASFVQAGVVDMVYDDFTQAWGTDVNQSKWEEQLKNCAGGGYRDMYQDGANMTVNATGSGCVTTSGLRSREWLLPQSSAIEIKIKGLDISKGGERVTHIGFTNSSSNFYTINNGNWYPGIGVSRVLSDKLKMYCYNPRGGYEFMQRLVAGGDPNFIDELKFLINFTGGNRTALLIMKTSAGTFQVMNTTVPDWCVGNVTVNATGYISTYHSITSTPGNYSIDSIRIHSDFAENPTADYIGVNDTITFKNETIAIFVNGSDDEGDTLTTYVTVFKNDTYNQTLYNSTGMATTVNHTYFFNPGFTRADNWTFVPVITGGGQNSSATINVSRYISDSLPRVHSVAITPALPSTVDDLVCNWMPKDNDTFLDDPKNGTMRWCVNNTVNWFCYNNTESFANNTINVLNSSSAGIQSEDTGVNFQFLCSVQVNDSVGASTWFNSSVVTVLSSPSGNTNFTSSPFTVGMYSDETVNVVLQVNNTGTYPLSYCTAYIAPSMQGFTTFNVSNFTIPNATNDVALLVTFKKPTVGVYSEQITVECDDSNIAGDNSSDSLTVTLGSSVRPIFIVDSGGGGGAVVIISTAKWVLTTLNGGKVYDLIFGDEMRTVEAMINNKDAVKRKIKLTCASPGDDCESVSFVDNDVILSEGEIKTVKFTVDMTDVLRVAPLQFTIIGTDEDGGVDSLVVKATKNPLIAFVVNTLMKLVHLFCFGNPLDSESKSIPIPVFVILSAVGLIVFAVSHFFLGLLKNKNGGVISLVFTVFILMVLLIMIPARDACL